MSIRTAIETATENVLSTYLAADLVARLSEEIITQAMPEVHIALEECLGFELPKAASKASKSAAPRKAKAPRARKNDDDEHTMSVSMPSAEDAREMLPA